MTGRKKFSECITLFNFECIQMLFVGKVEAERFVKGEEYFKRGGQVHKPRKMNNSASDIDYYLLTPTYY